MASPTNLVVEVDDTEYSRYEDGRKTITATVTSSITGGGTFAGEEVVVELVKARRNRDAAVATATITLSGTAPQSSVVTFYLPEIVDADEIHLVRHGVYFVQARHEATSLSADSPDFRISMLTVERLKSDYLFGVNLKATQILEAKFDPSQITGVTIREVSRDTPEGFGTLSYNYHQDHVSNAVATIGSGSHGTILVTADNDFAGEDGNALSVQVVVPAGTSPLSVTYGLNVLTISLSVSSGVPVTADNRALTVSAAISALDNFTAEFSGTGVDPLTSAEGLTAFAGGVTNVIRLLSWNGGPSVAVTSPGVVILQGGNVLGGNNPLCDIGGSSLIGTGYICVRISSVLLLPTSSVAEQLLITRKTIDDETLERYIDQAIDYLEEVALAVHLEPTNVVTDVDPTSIQYTAGVGNPAPIFSDADFDFVTTPLTYFAGNDTSEWIKLQTPFMSILRVDNLFGAIANTRVIDIDLDWIEFSEKGGLVQLVPFNQEIAFDFIGLIWSSRLRGLVALPNFWHYNMIVGLRECPKILQEVIGKKAAIEALTALAQAFRPGIGSTSISRDGVSESVSYNTQAQYGIYTATITLYKEFIENELQKFRGKYRGPTMVVV